MQLEPARDMSAAEVCDGSRYEGHTGVDHDSESSEQQVQRHDFAPVEPMPSRAEWPRPLFGRRHYRPHWPLFCDTGQSRRAMSTGTAENPKLVWTASQVVLISKEDAPSIRGVSRRCPGEGRGGDPGPTIRWGSSETMVPQLLADSWRRSDPRGRLPCATAKRAAVCRATGGAIALGTTGFSCEC